MKADLSGTMWSVAPVSATARWRGLASRGMACFSAKERSLTKALGRVIMRCLVDLDQDVEDVDARMGQESVVITQLEWLADGE